MAQSVSEGFFVTRFRLTQLLMLILARTAGAQNVTWVSMQDSQEHAFSIDVPKGWKVNGELRVIRIH